MQYIKYNVHIVKGGIGCKMDTRKLIKFGESSFVVSLPLQWIQKHKLLKGDSVYLEEHEKGLMLNPYKEDQKQDKKIMLNATGKDIYSIQREVVSAYLNNVNMIEITGKDIAERAMEITDFVRKLMSFEIVEQTGNRIVVKDFLNLKDISVPEVIRRMDIITRAMLDDAKLCVSQDLCQNIIYRDLDVNRFYYLVFRVIKGGMKNPSLAKMLKITQGELLDYYRLISCIEEIADCAKKISTSLRDLKINEKKSNELIALFEEAQAQYLEVMKGYYAKDKDIANKYSQAGKAFMNKCDKFLIENKMSDVSVVIEKMKVISKNTRSITRIIMDFEAELPI
jgi:phosphate uptake regulator